jgi:tetratricopeptide (TPR) repeat protein
MDKGDLDNAIRNYLEALKIYQKLDIKNTAVANTYNNIGIIYMDKGNYPKSLDFHIKSMQVFEQINELSSNYANVLNNIGIIYGKLKDFQSALNFYNRAEKSFKNINEQSLDVARVYNNIGDIYIKKGVLDTAEYYFKASIEIQKEINDVSNPLIIAYSNLGQIEELNKKYSSALSYYKKALKISEEIENRKEIAEALLDIGRTLVYQKKVKEGIANCTKSLNLSNELGLSESKMHACECLFEAYEKIGNISLAYKYYKLYENEKDSLLNQNNTKAITEKIMQYSFDKQQYQDSLRRAAEDRRLALIQKEKDINKEAEIQKQRAYSIAAGIGFILMLGLAFVLYKGYQNKQKANEIILKQKHAVEEQKEVIEEKNREIVDSISYAKRIQDAILPSQKTIGTILSEAFVYFNPKDIVSGDFYWVDKKDEYAFFAAVDCTGHGVPGALVSVVGHNGLNRVLNEFQINQPAEMLDKLTEIVEETFSKSSSSINDGMDLALCKLNTKTLVLEYAGANNPLYIIRDSSLIKDKEFNNFKTLTNKNNGKTLIEIKANKQPIGYYEYKKPFVNHQFQLIEGDNIYIFSDGFADQFGGEKGKKFMYKPFKKMLMELSNYSMKDQRSKIEAIFSQWKTGLEQIDDVCILGVKIS